ncbi:myb-related protein [Corchorus olitorius]|uniref:Myb-related protein n=1 Tax=Corchorus olitorius TaxID=93759 RepID=A0A1R3IZ48_9ROSI|nr:myb-related protein [Corchorus olitorius]
MNSEIIRAEPRGNGTTAGSIMKPRSPDMVPDSSRQQAGIMEESSMSSTPFNYVEFDQQGQEIVKEEDCGIGNLEEPASVGGEYLAKDFGEFDEVNILNIAATDGGCSKWEWEDLILDMDLWTDSL